MEELENFLKNQGISVAGSIDSKIFLELLLGASSTSKNIQDSFQNTHAEAANIAYKAKESLADEAKKTNYKELISKLLGISSENLDTTPLDVIRKEILSKSLEVSNEIKNSLDKINEETIRKITNPLGFPENIQNNLVQRQENINKSDEVSDNNDNNSKSNNNSSNSALEKILERFDQLISNQSDKLTIDQSKLFTIAEKTGLSLDVMMDFYKKSIEKKQQIDPFSKELYKKDPYGNLKVTLDPKSLSEIFNSLKINAKDQQKILQAIDETLNQSDKKLKEISDKPSGSGGGGMALAGLAGLGITVGLLAIVGTFARFILRKLILPLSSFSLAIGGAGLALGFFGESIGKYIDKLTGTKVASDAIDVASSAMGVDKPGGMDFYKNLFLYGGLGVGSLGAFLMKKRAGKRAVAVGSQITKKVAPRWAAIGSGVSKVASSAGSAILNILPKGLVTRSAALAGSVAALATRGTNAIKAVAQSSSIMGTILRGIGSASSAVASKLGNLTKIGALFGRGALGTFLKRIPLFGGLYELGMAIKRGMDGDYKGMWLRLASASSNLLYLLGPEMAFIQIPLSMYLDSLDEQDQESKQQASEQALTNQNFNKNGSASTMADASKNNEMGGENDQFYAVDGVEVDSNGSASTMADDSKNNEMGGENDQFYTVDGVEVDSNRPTGVETPKKWIPIGTPTPVTPPPNIDLREALPIPAPTPKTTSLSPESIEELRRAISNGSDNQGSSTVITGGNSKGSVSGERDEVREYRQKYNARNYSNTFRN